MKRPRTALLAAAGVAVVMLVLLAVLVVADPATERQSQSPLVGKPAPELSGEQVDTTRSRGALPNNSASTRSTSVTISPSQRAASSSSTARGAASSPSHTRSSATSRTRSHGAPGSSR